MPSVGSELGNLRGALVHGLDQVRAWLTGPPFHLSPTQVDAAVARIRAQASASNAVLLHGALAGALLALEIAASILLTIVLTFFFVKDGGSLATWLGGFAEPSRRDRMQGAAALAWQTFSAYVQGTAINGLVNGTLMGLGLTAIGVPLAVPIAVITFFGGFFPLVGGLISGGIAVLVALASTGIRGAILVLALTTLIHHVEGYVVGPFVLGRKVRLHAVVIVLALSVGTVVGGVFGAFVAVPVTAISLALIEFYRGLPIEIVATTDQGRSLPELASRWCDGCRTGASREGIAPALFPSWRNIRSSRGLNRPSRPRTSGRRQGAPHPSRQTRRPTGTGAFVLQEGGPGGGWATPGWRIVTGGGRGIPDPRRCYPHNPEPKQGRGRNLGRVSTVTHPAGPSESRRCVGRPSKPGPRCVDTASPTLGPATRIPRCKWLYPRRDRWERPPRQGRSFGAEARREHKTDEPVITGHSMTSHSMRRRAMRAKEREAIRARLDAEHDRLLTIKASVVEGSDLDPSERARTTEPSMSDLHPADVGTETFEREKDLSILEHIDSEIREVAWAIRRLDDGSYGTCEDCGRQITPARLGARPATRYCLDDQARRERLTSAS